MFINQVISRELGIHAEKKSINKGLNQIQKGETLTNEEVDKEIDEWLKG